MSPREKTDIIRRLALRVGFDRVGIAEAGPLPRGRYLRRWLAAGHAGQMEYLSRYLDKRLDVRILVPGARSVIVTALNYHRPAPDRPNDQLRGRVARYAWGDDYHRIIKKRLFALADGLRKQIEEPFESRAYVDTAPIVEREWAAMAGLGWIGKNTMVLNRELGSYFFLGVLVTTLELVSDTPLADRCGTCTRCLDACPTHAFPAPYQMDASRCISYLTIELRDPIPPEFHRQMGDWVFGCDICQEVCPYNSRAPVTDDFSPRTPGPFPSLADLLAWSDDEYRRQLRGSAMKRARPEMLRRSARIALGNSPPQQASSTSSGRP